MFDGACSVMHVVTARQQVQHRTFPLKSDVMALLGLTTGDDGKRERGLTGYAGETHGRCNIKLTKEMNMKERIRGQRGRRRNAVAEKMLSSCMSASANQQALNAF